MQAIAFDAYGTLVEITERANPLSDLLPREGDPRAAARRVCMTQDLGPSELAAHLGITDPTDVARLEERLRREVDSVRLYPEVEETLDRLRSARLRLAVVSNLAPPYAEPVRRLLGKRIDAYVWSFEVGAVKPEPRIFEEVCSRLGLPPWEVLMVGDSLASDIEGARRFGMPACHLDRRGGATVQPSISTLAELPAQLALL